MTPKEKAKELLNKFRPHSKYWDCRNDEPLEENHAKQCALIAVDEVLAINKEVWDDFHDDYFVYWLDVKKEIELL
jgi:hypothetical protein